MSIVRERERERERYKHGHTHPRTNKRIQVKKEICFGESSHGIRPAMPRHTTTHLASPWSVRSSPPKMLISGCIQRYIWNWLVTHQLFQQLNVRVGTWTSYTLDGISIICNKISAMKRQTHRCTGRGVSWRPWRRSWNGVGLEITKKKVEKNVKKNIK